MSINSFPITGSLKKAEFLYENDEKTTIVFEGFVYSAHIRLHEEMEGF